MLTRNKLTSHDKLKGNSPWGINDNKKSRFAKRFLCRSLFWIASYDTLLMSKSSETFSVLDGIAVYVTIIWARFQKNGTKHKIFLKQNRPFHFLTKSFRLARKFAAIHLSSVSGGLNSQFEEQAYATNRGWIGELSIFFRPMTRRLFAVHVLYFLFGQTSIKSLKWPKNSVTNLLEN